MSVRLGSSDLGYHLRGCGWGFTEERIIDKDIKNREKWTKQINNRQ